MMAQAATSVQPAPELPSIVQYWHAESVPDYVRDQVATFQDRNPHFHHRMFSASQAERFIGERYGSREVAAFRACAIPSMQSDYLRYCAVLALGGVYADVDYRCLKSLGPLVRSAAGGIFLGPRTRLHKGRRVSHVWSGFFSFGAPGHPLLELTLEIATANMEARIAQQIWPANENAREAIWLTVGPGIFTLARLIRDLGSFDAFVEDIAGTLAEPFGELYCEVIGDYERLIDAFEGVRVLPYERALDWVEDVPSSELPYKQTELHWHNVKASIFN